MGISSWDRPDPLYKYVRKRRRKWEARVWISQVIGHIELGYYETRSAAWQVIRVWMKAGCHPARGLPAGILPKWVVRNGDGFSVRMRFAGREVTGGPLVRVFATAEEAFAGAEAQVEWIRRTDGWLDEPLPSGVVVRAAGYALRYWHRNRVLVQAGPFESPTAAVAMLPVNARMG